MTDHAERVFAAAVDLHQQGKLDRAEGLYRQVLQTVPQHLDSLNLLGLVAIQTGRNGLAVELIGKAIALNDKVADFHNNIGEAFRRLGQLDRAVDHFAKAVHLEPTFVEAQYNLGDGLRGQGKLDQAAAIYSRILARKPDSVAAHGRLGDILHRQGKLDEAIAHLRQNLVFRPGSAEAHNNLGIALKEQGQLDDAIAQFRRAVSLKQDFAEAHNNLGNVLRERGQLDLAVTELTRATALKPDLAAAFHNLALAHLAASAYEQAAGLAIRAVELHESHENKALFVRCVKNRPSAMGPVNRRSFLLRALSEPWGRAGELMNASVCEIKTNGAVRRLVDRVGKTWPNTLPVTELLDGPDFDALAADELLKCLLESAPIADVGLERLLTALRSALLDSTEQSPERMKAASRLGFFCALARQCFINDYVFFHAEPERERAHALRDSLDTALDAGASIPAFWPVAVGCYGPLHCLSRANGLLGISWPEPVNELLTQQIRDPAVVREYCASMPRLTAIDDGVSLAVRRQYEESPYPSWVKVAPADEWATIDAYLRNLFPMTHLDGSGGRSSDILIAGCGTGQQSIETAQRFPRARVLAVDLSLASLGYARAKSQAAGMSNIEYAQADILQLGTIGRTFDVIETTGVLHHLDDPMRGWQILLSLLRPGGFMRLGLYSRLARQGVQAARSWIARRGHHDTADGIRRCRQEMMALGEGHEFGILTRSPDFTSTSACRDLLFHTHERQLTLLEIDSFLADNTLGFLGFELEASVHEQYRSRFPHDEGMTKLDLWHAFETERPHTFGGMYQFWIQKPWGPS